PHRRRLRRRHREIQKNHPRRRRSRRRKVAQKLLIKRASADFRTISSGFHTAAVEKVINTDTGGTDLYLLFQSIEFLFSCDGGSDEIEVVGDRRSKRFMCPVGRRKIGRKFKRKASRVGWPQENQSAA